MEALSNSRIEAAYRERTRRSAELAKEALELFPSGITHDSRRLDPYAIYVDRAEGPRKWDVDGNEYIDYFGGHGALLLGHHRPEIDRAISRCTRPRHPLRVEPRRRGALGAGGQGTGAVRGARPVHLIGNRSHSPRAPDRPRRHRGGARWCVSGLTSTAGTTTWRRGIPRTSTARPPPVSSTRSRAAWSCSTPATSPRCARRSRAIRTSRPPSWSRPARRSGSSPCDQHSLEALREATRRMGRCSSSTRW